MRSLTASAFHAAFSYRWLSAALQAAVVHLHLLNIAFGTLPLPVDPWCVRVAPAACWGSAKGKSCCDGG
ncbi:hypothetical protein [Methyloversatilis sp.]|uniref:hypothetical protein n=1 Tax=Methyloversatilis sp. TaxID=2569862 RepID=UPI0027338835|nr:hypothetical protein [Methyloversatilis sp.]MDP2867388.1 hypothetical protein [Methyloversatilis sp.]MDP3456858.1 hypothetical protein [Methyloversatilis sp.]MDP3580132.1 hypothetical protein [Methyloversatilis sp.]